MELPEEEEGERGRESATNCNNPAMVALPVVHRVSELMPAYPVTSGV